MRRFISILFPMLLLIVLVLLAKTCVGKDYRSLPEKRSKELQKIMDMIKIDMSLPENTGLTIFMIGKGVIGDNYFKEFSRAAEKNPSLQDNSPPLIHGISKSRYMEYLSLLSQIGAKSVLYRSRKNTWHQYSFLLKRYGLFGRSALCLVYAPDLPPEDEIPIEFGKHEPLSKEYWYLFYETP